MNEMIIRIAEAMRLKRYELINKPLDRIYRDLAIAAIEAMKEPTEEMLNHISYTKDEYESEFIKHNYIELIKAALK